MKTKWQLPIIYECNDLLTRQAMDSCTYLLVDLVEGAVKTHPSRPAKFNLPGHDSISQISTQGLLHI